MKKNNIEIITHGDEYIEEESIVVCPECMNENIKILKMKEEFTKWIFDIIIKYNKCHCKKCNCVFITNKTKKIKNISKIAIMKRVMFLSAFILASLIIFYLSQDKCDSPLWIGSALISCGMLIYSIFWFALAE